MWFHLVGLALPPSAPLRSEKRKSFKCENGKRVDDAKFASDQTEVARGRADGCKADKSMVINLDLAPGHTLTTISTPLALPASLAFCYGAGLLAYSHTYADDSFTQTYKRL